MLNGEMEGTWDRRPQLPMTRAILCEGTGDPLHRELRGTVYVDRLRSEAKISKKSG